MTLMCTVLAGRSSLKKRKKKALSKWKKKLCKKRGKKIRVLAGRHVALAHVLESTKKALLKKEENLC